MKLPSVDQRPWPVPRGPWVMAQSWHDLLFAHWPIKLETLRPLIPAGLEIETFGGEAWLGVVPFRMSGVRPRWLPGMPWLSAFPELNVRTYVRAEGKPGVFFFSLEAANPIAVQIARGVFHLPYFNARMSLRNGKAIYYQSRRIHRGAPYATFVGSYRPTGPVFTAHPGSLEYFLTARYCLYAVDGRGQIYRGEIHHQPWPLQPAAAEIVVNTMADAACLELPHVAPLLHFSKRLDVVVWPLQPILG